MSYFILVEKTAIQVFLCLLLTIDSLENIKPKVYSLKSGLDILLLTTITKFDTVWINTFALIICELIQISRKRNF